jgi:integrase
MATIKKMKRKGEKVSYKITFVNPHSKKWTSKTVRCSYKDALKIKAGIEGDIVYNQLGMANPEKRKYFWSQLKKRYLRDSEKNKSSETLIREKAVFKVFDKFLQKDFPVSKIDSRIIENFRETRLLAVSPATVSIEMRVLKTTFNQAIKWELLEKNPVKGVKIPKQDIIKVRFLTKDEIQRLIDIIKQDGNYDFLDLLNAYLNTGARRIELLPPYFIWDNVDFEGKKILLHGKGDRKRYIPMNKTLLEILQRRHESGCDQPFKFNRDFVSHKIAKYYRQVEIKGANLHSLRKTFGSLLLQNRMADLFTVSRLLGHTSVKTTEKYYVDLLQDNLRDSVNGLDGII